MTNADRWILSYVALGVAVASGILFAGQAACGGTRNEAGLLDALMLLMLGVGLTLPHLLAVLIAHRRLGRVLEGFGPRLLLAAAAVTVVGVLAGIASSGIADPAQSVLAAAGVSVVLALVVPAFVMHRTRAGSDRPTALSYAEFGPALTILTVPITLSPIVLSMDAAIRCGPGEPEPLPMLYMGLAPVVMLTAGLIAVVIGVVYRRRLAQHLGTLGGE